MMSQSAKSENYILGSLTFWDRRQLQKYNGFFFKNMVKTHWNTDNSSALGDMYYKSVAVVYVYAICLSII